MQKIFLRFLFFIFLSVFTCVGAEEKTKATNEEIAKQEYRNYLYDFHVAFGKQIEEAFPLKWKGPHSEYLLGGNVTFHACRRATIEEARALFFVILDKLVQAVDEDPILLAHLKTQSLSPESIGVEIRFVKSDGWWSYEDGSIGEVSYGYCRRDGSNTRQRCVEYTTTDPFPYNSRSKEFVETLEEALKLNRVASIIDPTVHKSTKFEDELDRIFAAFKKEVEQEYDMCFGALGWMRGGQSTNDISEIHGHCAYFLPVDRRDARELMMQVSEKLLSLLNGNEKLKPYLKEVPFSANQLKLHMIFRRKVYCFGGDEYEGGIQSVVLDGNSLSYYRRNPDNREKVVYKTESFQEAQKKIKNSPPRSIGKKIGRVIIILVSYLDRFLEVALYITFCLVLFVCIPTNWVFILPAIAIIMLVLFILRKRRKGQRPG